MIASLSKPSGISGTWWKSLHGGPLAVSADYSFIVPSGTMIVHPVRSNGMFYRSIKATEIWSVHKTA